MAKKPVKCKACGEPAWLDTGLCADCEETVEKNKRRKMADLRSSRWE